MTKPRRKRPDWLKPLMAGLIVAALGAGAAAVYMNRPQPVGDGGTPDPADMLKDRAFKEYWRRVDGYRACHADSDCARVKIDCTCSAVTKAALPAFEADRARTFASAGAPVCPAWPEPSCEDATSSAVCASGTCRAHVVLEDAAWDQ